MCRRNIVGVGQGELLRDTAVAQKRRRPRDARGTPERTETKGRQGDTGVHTTPWQRTLSHACHAKEAETKGPTPAQCTLSHATQERRRPRDARGTPGRIVPRHAREAETKGRQRDTGRDPLVVHQVPRLPRKRGGDQGTPEGHRGAHPTSWQCTLSHACHAKEAWVMCVSVMSVCVRVHIVLMSVCARACVCVCLFVFGFFKMSFKV